MEEDASRAENGKGASPERRGDNTGELAPLGAGCGAAAPRCAHCGRPISVIDSRAYGHCFICIRRMLGP